MRFAENAMPRSNIHEAPSVGGLEDVEDDACGKYRALYTVKFDVAVFFLHCFQNKSERGIATLKEDHHSRQAPSGRSACEEAITWKNGSLTVLKCVAVGGNVYADLGLPDAEKRSARPAWSLKLKGRSRRSRSVWRPPNMISSKVLA